MSQGVETGIGRATFLNLLGFIVPVLVQLVTVPLFLRVIGVDRFGVMALVWLLLGYFGFFDLGFGRAIASRIAGLSANASQRTAVFWTGTCLSVLSGVAGGLLLYAAAARVFTDVFAVPGNLLAETNAALPCMALALPVVTGISALSGALQGREAFGALNLSQITGSVLYQVFPLLVALFISVHLPALVLAAIAGRLVTAFMLFGFCLRHVPAGLRPRIAKTEIRPLLTFGGWVSVTGVISPLLTIFDRFVIAAVAGMQQVAAYTIPYNLVMRIAALPASLQNALFPRFAMVSAADAHRLQQRAVRLIASVMTPPLILGILLMKPFLTIWIGAGLANTAAPVGQILILGLWPNMLAFIPFSFLQSRGQPHLPALFHIAELFFYAPALYFATAHYGVAGAAWAWGARTALDAVLLFAAVGLVRGLAACWFSLALVVAAFICTTDTAAGVMNYGAGMLVFIMSLVWAFRFLPQDMRAFIMPKRLSAVPP